MCTGIVLGLIGGGLLWSWPLPYEQQENEGVSHGNTVLHVERRAPTTRISNEDPTSRPVMGRYLLQARLTTASSPCRVPNAKKCRDYRIHMTAVLKLYFQFVASGIRKS
jgi:hypothetical protein